ncbi:adrenodoxin-like [Lytechinus pictus]|uniref:adrenodoxin-like n=1 Tax=Lytechinus pictus TaxID=7653 RepID=UPI00240D5F42|nr:adrenodoxin-like [Lytechinus pictus]
MYFSTILRTVRLPVYRRPHCQLSCSILGPYSYGNTSFRANSCFVKNSPTNFCMNGTVSRTRFSLKLRTRDQICTASDLHSAHLSNRNSLVSSIQQVRIFSSSDSMSKKEEITVNFLNRDGETFIVKAKVGETLLDTVIDNDVDIDGFGACEGTLACSTCHLIFDEDIFETLPEKLDEEEDMLDLAYGLEDTSRLGCQISLTKEMDNMVVRVPEGINDARDV